MTGDHLAVAAQALAGLGWRVMPIKPQAKEPLTKHGVKDATTDEKVILRWFRRWPEANLAIATGAPGPQVLDIDDPHAAGNLLPQLRQIHPPTVAAVRGPHLYFAGSGLATVSLGFGELRGVGSYILVPPSIHPSGKEYVWIDSPNGPLPEFPAVLLPHQRTAGTGDFDAPEDLIPVGQRHDALKDAAVRFLRGGFTDAATIEQMLKSFFEMRCDPNPPPRKDEFRKIAHWAATSDMAERERNSKPLLDPKPDGEKPSKTKKSKLDKAPGAGATLTEHKAYVQLAAGLPAAVTVDKVVRRGSKGVYRLRIELSNGQGITFDQQEQITSRRHWARIVIGATNGLADPASLTDVQAQKVFRSLCLLADAPPEVRDTQELEDVLDDFLSLTTPVDDLKPDTTEERFELIAHCRSQGSWDPRDRNPDKQPQLIVGRDGARYVRAGELFAYVRYRDLGITPASLQGRMHEIGAEHVVLHGREQRRPDRAGRRTNHMVVYRLPSPLSE